MINSCNQNLFLFIDEALTLKRVNILLRLSEPTYALGERAMVTLILLGCIGIMYKLPSLDCINCFVDSLRFGVFIAHLDVVLKTRLACFHTGRVLMRDFGYTGADTSDFLIRYKQI